MKHFLTQVLCGAALTLASAGLADAAEKAVVVISADGTQRQELLTNVDRIEIGETSLTLKTVGGETRTTAYDELDRVLIGTEYSAIQQITSPVTMRQFGPRMRHLTTTSTLRRPPGRRCRDGL